MKKTLSIIALSLLSTSVAQAGIYVGADTLFTKGEVNKTFELKSLIKNYNSKEDINYNNTAYGAHVGYRFPILDLRAELGYYQGDGNAVKDKRVKVSILKDLIISNFIFRPYVGAEAYYAKSEIMHKNFKVNKNRNVFGLVGGIDTGKMLGDFTIDLRYIYSFDKTQNIDMNEINNHYTKKFNFEYKPNKSVVQLGVSYYF